DKLDLQPTDHLLEIGTGWGGCAVFAAQHYGCRVTTTTISRQQYDYAVQRVAKAGLADKITVLLEDYRDLRGQYNKLISIEMVEAVGHHYIDDYFQRCADLLTPDGLAIIQAITLEDHRYAQAVKSVDFIKRYIFPGSFIPSVTVLSNAAAKAKLKLTSLEDIGPSYAITLATWRERFNASLDKVRAMGYPDSFIRMWEFYLCYCEGGFAERSISDVHLLFSKVKNRRAQWCPEYA
ncbi:MAG TPA: SAM-dependent methyltransferase, partial [Methylophaga sp.]|nr:SAM-dependent methyltransferase [Methylophaga sp.]